jgi:hypothetical protein
MALEQMLRESRFLGVGESDVDVVLGEADKQPGKAEATSSSVLSD